VPSSAANGRDDDRGSPDCSVGTTQRYIYNHDASKIGPLTGCADYAIGMTQDDIHNRDISKTGTSKVCADCSIDARNPLARHELWSYEHAD
jgi:hypothetical protein